MQSSFGWTLLSREALRRAETQLREEVEGVRDEIGFLALHQAYADRFFPGTSVLHTRLRYVLFVPWIYQDLHQHVDRPGVAAYLEGRELELTRRLKAGGEVGVIGSRSYPKPTAQPPSMSYWSALGTWGILRPNSAGAIPSRQAVHRTIARRSSGRRLHDDDRQLLAEEEPLFYSVPPPCAAWHDSTKRLDFRLERQEAVFLKKCFLSLARPGGDKAHSLLARVVDQGVQVTDRMELWSPAMRMAADRQDREALQRARQAAGLSAIGRAVYAALVEETREQHDGIPTETVHRENLEGVVARFAAKALALEVSKISVDAPAMPKGILEVLQATQDWLRSGRADKPDGLYECYERAEVRRKGRRARLARTILGRERRAEWLPQDHPKAAPLHYRWANVRQLLTDLQKSL
jgi:hypothetical protein